MINFMILVAVFMITFGSFILDKYIPIEHTTKHFNALDKFSIDHKIQDDQKNLFSVKQYMKIEIGTMLNNYKNNSITTWLKKNESSIKYDLNDHDFSEFKSYALLNDEVIFTHVYTIQHEINTLKTLENIQNYLTSYQKKYNMDPIVYLKEKIYYLKKDAHGKFIFVKPIDANVRKIAEYI